MSPSQPASPPAPQPRVLADRIPPVALVLGGVVSVQVGAAIAKTLFGSLGATGTVMLRIAVSALVLLAAWRPRVRGRTRADLAVAALFGLTLAAMNFFFYQALDRIPLGVAVTVEFTGPLGVAVAASRRPLDLLWVALAAGGILLLSDGGAAGVDPVGVVFALAAGACWAGYILLSQRVGRRFARGDGLAVAMAVGALVLLPAGVLDAGAALLDPRLLGLGALVAVLSSLLPYSLEMEALRRMPARVFGILMSCEPAVGALAGFMLLSQTLSARQVVAIGLVVVASAGATRGAARPVDG